MASTEITELTQVEQCKLSNYESIIDEGLQTFVDVGRALLAIRDGKLYRASHGTFAAYCEDRFGKTRDWAYKLISAANVSENVYHGIQNEIPEPNERQARELAKLPADEQATVWHELNSEGDKITAADVKAAVAARLAPAVEAEAEPEEPQENASSWLGSDDTKDEEPAPQPAPVPPAKPHEAKPDTFTYGSLFSGIEAASVAWSHMEWKPAWFAEVDPFCSSLLSHYYPETPNYGDVTERNDWPGVDLIVGGSPCQSFSVNGKREGMADARGNLTLRYADVIDAVRPRWFVWENVPGVLRSNGGKDFGAFIQRLVQSGYGITWRVLDAQYFGVPQRRRRVFLVGHSSGNPRVPAAVLLDPSEGEADDPAAGKTQQADDAASQAFDPTCVYGFTGDTTPKFGREMTPTLRAYQGGEGVGVIGQNIFRKLTVTEWERLQGFPDDYTKVEHKGKPASDTARKRAIGNSFCVPVVRWIGERIQFVEEVLSDEE